MYKNYANDTYIDSILSDVSKRVMFILDDNIPHGFKVGISGYLTTLFIMELISLLKVANLKIYIYIMCY